VATTQRLGPVAALVVLFAGGGFIGSGLEARPSQDQTSPPAAQGNALPQRIRVSQGVSSRLIAKKVPPQYPHEAREQHIQGQVVLKAQISKEGDVIQLELVSGHPMLVPAAIEAVKQWKYKPFLLNGQPLVMETQVTVNFTLAPPEDSSTDPNPSGVVGNVPGGTPCGQTGAADGAVLARNADGPQRVRLSGDVAQGLIATKIQPEYPELARTARIQGTVCLKAVISKEGDVAEIHLISGHPTLAQAAIDAVKQWKYKPYLLDGRPVEVETQVTVNFTLAGD
jgi:TonB family protein